MEKLPWFKLYTDIIHDPKIRRLTPEERWLWIVLLSLAAQSDDRGTVYVTVVTEARDGSRDGRVTRAIPYENSELADMCGCDWSGEQDPRKMVEKALEKFTRLGMIEFGIDGEIIIKNFIKRQDSHLSEAERAKRYRGNKLRDDRHTASRDGLKKIVTLEKEKDTEKDTEKEKRSSSKPPPAQIVHPKTDEDFFLSLKSNSAYQHIDFDQEFGRMRAWLELPKNKQRKLTRQFALNWLNRIDKPIGGKSHGKFESRTEGLREYLQELNSVGERANDPDGGIPKIGISEGKGGGNVRSPPGFDARRVTTGLPEVLSPAQGNIPRDELDRPDT